MPGLTGAQTLERIRCLHPELPILISSGQPGIEEWECFKRPKVGVISKPFTMQEIVTKLIAMGVPIHGEIPGTSIDATN
jgi:CheY-like chemotaxis protein